MVSSTTPFNPEAKQMFKAALPIFRKGDMLQYDAVQERSDDAACDDVQRVAQLLPAASRACYEAEGFVY